MRRIHSAGSQGAGPITRDFPHLGGGFGVRDGADCRQEEADRATERSTLATTAVEVEYTLLPYGLLAFRSRRHLSSPGPMPWAGGSPM